MTPANALWAEFAERFQFRASINPDKWPAIVEPTPSMVWDLSPIFDGDYTGCRDVAALVLGTLQDCTEWPQTVVFHDWVHPSGLLQPHKVNEPEEVPGWDIGGLFPNGDYTIFVGRDYAFGILGHPWERSLYVFGEHAVAAFATRNRGVLTTVLRRDGPARHRWRLRNGTAFVSMDLAVFAVAAGADEATARAVMEACYRRGEHVEGDLDERIVAFYENLRAAYPDFGPGPSAPQAAAKTLLAWLATTTSRWLVVLDDLVDPHDLDGWWPPLNPTGRVLVTTRRNDAALASRGTVIPIEVFTRAESLAYLAAKLADHPDQLAQAGELAHDLGDLPVALDQAAAYIVDRDITCADYRTRFADRQHSLLELAPDVFPNDYTRPVAATLSLSVEVANQLPPAGLARPLLTVLALLDPNGVPVDLLTTPPCWTTSPLTATRSSMPSPSMLSALATGWVAWLGSTWPVPATSETGTWHGYTPWCSGPPGIKHQPACLTRRSTPPRRACSTAGRRRSATEGWGCPCGQTPRRCASMVSIDYGSPTPTLCCSGRGRASARPDWWRPPLITSSSSSRKPRSGSAPTTPTR